MNNAVYTRRETATEQERLYLRATETLQQTLAVTLNPGRLAALQDKGVFGNTYEFNYVFDRVTNRLQVHCTAIGLTAVFRLRPSSSTCMLEQFSGTSHESIILSLALRQLLTEPVSTSESSSSSQPMQLC